ncbi:hypothetical protein FHW96_001569 [Novosphingobium sp. SG751A]|uniref:hypothetical protein n=1 Tax=Novosphingobium sp. SG751A TaxID=2587000 RepID=UPI00155725A7|nr:hypothetical protein [Novosphingobium sp. SG751A]NOW45414.1 hypothetical protein [Novosphingobium sp. SG751A]
MTAAPLLLSLLLAASVAGDTSEEATPSPCYDVAVRAKLIDQIPSIMPECDDCLIMSWPWFVDLKVARVLEGHLDDKVVTALVVQHTYHVSRYGVWKLRHNAVGGYNVVQGFDSDKPPARCAAGTPPAKPYIRSKDKSLDDLRNEGIKQYGHYPKQ